MLKKYSNKIKEFNSEYSVANRKQRYILGIPQTQLLSKEELGIDFEKPIEYSIFNKDFYIRNKKHILRYLGVFTLLSGMSLFSSTSIFNSLLFKGFLGFVAFDMVTSFIQIGKNNLELKESSNLKEKLKLHVPYNFSHTAYKHKYNKTIRNYKAHINEGLNERIPHLDQLYIGRLEDAKKALNKVDLEINNVEFPKELKKSIGDLHTFLRVPNKEFNSNIEYLHDLIELLYVISMTNKSKEFCNLSESLRLNLEKGSEPAQYYILDFYKKLDYMINSINTIFMTNTGMEMLRELDKDYAEKYLTPVEEIKKIDVKEILHL